MIGIVAASAEHTSCKSVHDSSFIFFMEGITWVVLGQRLVRVYKTGSLRCVPVPPKILGYPNGAKVIVSFQIKLDISLGPDRQSAVHFLLQLEDENGISNGHLGQSINFIILQSSIMFRDGLTLCQ
jgi:hypothetical protein